MTFRVKKGGSSIGCYSKDNCGSPYRETSFLKKRKKLAVKPFKNFPRVKGVKA